MKQNTGTVYYYANGIKQLYFYGKYVKIRQTENIQIEIYITDPTPIIIYVNKIEFTTYNRDYLFQMPQYNGKQAC